MIFRSIHVVSTVFANDQSNVHLTQFGQLVRFLQQVSSSSVELLSLCAVRHTGRER